MKYFFKIKLSSYYLIDLTLNVVIYVYMQSYYSL